jgi:hypothetical protein
MGLKSEDEDDVALVMKPKMKSFSKPPALGKKASTLLQKNLSLGGPKAKPSLMLDDNLEDQVQEDSSNTVSEDASD